MNWVPTNLTQSNQPFDRVQTEFSRLTEPLSQPRTV